MGVGKLLTNKYKMQIFFYLYEGFENIMSTLLGTQNHSKNKNIQPSENSASF